MTIGVLSVSQKLNIFVYTSIKILQFKTPQCFNISDVINNIYAVISSITLIFNRQNNIIS